MTLVPPGRASVFVHRLLDVIVFVVSLVPVLTRFNQINECLNTFSSVVASGSHPPLLSLLPVIIRRKAKERTQRRSRTAAVMEVSVVLL